VLGLNSIYLYTLAHNVRAQRAYQKAGFKKAGVYRQMMFVEGKFNDAIAMDILKDEFFELYPPGSRVGEAPSG
jgi:RimJ/RimL family protein N-acetyltransferase